MSQLGRVSRDGTRKEDTPLPTTPIWRYLHDYKFYGDEGLLNTSAIYFRNVQRLLKGDPLEGSYPVPDQQGRDKAAPLRPWCYVSCWQMGKESEQMWGEYTNWDKGENAVAVVSRYDTLFELLMPLSMMRIAPVHYIDFETEHLRAMEALQVLVGPVYLPFFHKLRKQFEHERELRAARMWLPPDGKHEADQAPARQLVRVDLNRLIDHVVLPPGAGPQVRQWVEERLESVGLRKEVRRSRWTP